MRSIPMGSLAALAMSVVRPCLAAEAHVPAPSLVWDISLVGLLQSIAVLPLVAAGPWHHSMDVVALIWTLGLLIPQVFFAGPWSPRSPPVEYLPFALPLALKRLILPDTALEQYRLTLNQACDGVSC